jgi:hypothetical protein
MQVYIIDYGLAKKYRDLQTHKHIPYRLVKVAAADVDRISVFYDDSINNNNNNQAFYSSKLG